jgi:hypothetical protein
MISKQNREVHFDKYCKRCKYKEVDMVEDPCNACLDEPVREYSHKPVCFEEKE